ncbi:AAA ATPase, putative [Trypanosoma brucei gambiense DAL972]|uniref:AAA ATPase, putative n=1 Tax=Trypanosoma brucei gambiense (strain MHOM/CI/86/DAL972) TaxID=679716 RepID=C9ZK16_TRYB9|nr:AAA ATPase, putative [Trypanosoma brucei gambiense DAL972]CBH09780.1 AAA ATPase, putative [Trypanosoma brucei gambiense DAL972]|eukprot:XP_011772073.1 AAA ATPase, putative [Trypanosoma brucei gambiense DAL972]
MGRHHDVATATVSASSKGPLFSLTGRGGEVKRARELIASIGGTLTSNDNKADYLVAVKGAGRRKVEDFCNARQNNSPTDSGNKVVLLDMLEEWSSNGSLPKRRVRMEDAELTNLFSAAANERARRSYEVPPSFLKRSRVTLDAEGSVVDESDNAVLLKCGPTRLQLGKMTSSPSSAATVETVRCNDRTSPVKNGKAAGTTRFRPLLLDDESPDDQPSRHQKMATEMSGKVNPMRLAFRQRPKPDWDTYFSDPSVDCGVLTTEGSTTSTTFHHPACSSKSIGSQPKVKHTRNEAISDGNIARQKKNGALLLFDTNKVNSNGRSSVPPKSGQRQRGTASIHSCSVGTKTASVLSRSAGSAKIPPRQLSTVQQKKKEEQSISHASRNAPEGDRGPRIECPTGTSASLCRVVPTVRRANEDSASSKKAATSGASRMPPSLPPRLQAASKSSRTDGVVTTTDGAVPPSTRQSWNSRPSSAPAAPAKQTGVAARRSTCSDPLLKRVRQSIYCEGISEEACAAVLQQVVDRACPVNFDSIAGLDTCKRILQETIILPAKCPQLFTGLRRPCSGLLLFGPPGNGKTLLAKAVANECNTTFFSISAAAITSKWVGESEKMVRALFSVARALAPSTIFIDEVDSLLQARGAAQEGEGSRRMKTEFLVQMDGAGNDTQMARVLVMGATNRPFDLDEAVIRRFPKRVFVPLPDAPARAQILQKLLNTVETPNTLSSEAWERVVKLTSGYSGHDLRQLCEDAAMIPVRELVAEKLRKGENLAEHAHNALLRPLTLTDVEACVSGMNPSCCPKLLNALEDWSKTFGSK